MAHQGVPEEWTVLVLWTLMIVVVSEVAVCSLLMILMCASLPKLWETFVPTLCSPHHLHLAMDTVEIFRGSQSLYSLF
jgi:hypothetical protein